MSEEGPVGRCQRGFSEEVSKEGPVRCQKRVQ